MPPNPKVMFSIPVYHKNRICQQEIRKFLKILVWGIGVHHARSVFSLLNKGFTKQLKEEATLSFTTEPTATGGEGIRDKGYLFMTSILKKALFVKGNFEKEVIPKRIPNKCKIECLRSKPK